MRLKKIPLFHLSSLPPCPARVPYLPSVSLSTHVHIIRTLLAVEGVPSQGGGGHSVLKERENALQSRDTESQGRQERRGGGEPLHMTVWATTSIQSLLRGRQTLGSSER